MPYSDEEMLMLSGIQHFRFCPRQWAFIHIEQQWEENRLTVEGELLHKHADDPFYRQKCGDCIALRSVNIASYELGLYGIADIVELQPTEDKNNSITHPKYPGCWLPYPIEYKHGKPKKNEIDEVQLAAQAMCLEEMYSITIKKGAFFYGEIKHRVEIEISTDLREIVKQCATAMHELYNNMAIPKAKKAKHCAKCSIQNICLPQIESCTKVSTYLENNLYL